MSVSATGSSTPTVAPSGGGPIVSTLGDFELLSELGKGAFGTVYKVRRKVDDSIYVLKQIPLAHLSVREQQACITEVRLLAAIDSQYVVRYYDSFISTSGEEGVLNIVQEYCEEGDLQQLLKRQQQTLLPASAIWSFFLQILLALHHLHNNYNAATGKKSAILHRDLKPANFFIARGGKLKVGDLGVARMLGTQSAFAHTTVGTPYFLSPELCEGKAYNEKSDIWAAGVVLYQLCTLKQPFDAQNQGALILKIMRGKYPPLPAVYAGTKFPRILDAMLRKDTSLRPNSTQIMASQAVYAKAKEMGFVLPKEVEEMVDKRTHTNVVHAQAQAQAAAQQTARQTSRALKARTQALPTSNSSVGATDHTFGHAPSIASASAVDPSFTRTLQLHLPTKKNRAAARGRMGNSSALAANTPIVSGVAPARPTPGLVKPVLRPTKHNSARPPKRSTPSTPAAAAAAAAVANLPDHVPGAPIMPMARPVGSFVPSPETDEHEAAGGQWPQANPSPAGGYSSPASSPAAAGLGKPSVRAFQQAFSNPFTIAPTTAHAQQQQQQQQQQQLLSTSHFAVGASSSLDDTDASLVVCHPFSSQASTLRTDRSHQQHQQDDGPDTPRDDEYSQDDNDRDDASPHDDSSASVSDADDATAASSSSVDTLASAFSHSSFSVDADDLDADLVDTTGEENDDPLTGSADEVQWRVLEEEMDDATRDADQHADDDDGLYDEEEDEPEDNSANSTPRPHTPSPPPRPSLTPLPHHLAPAQLLGAVRSRVEKLQSHRSDLQSEVEHAIGVQGCQQLYDHFAQAAAGTGSSPAGGAPPPAITRLLQAAHQSQVDVVTKLYQVMYLEEEVARCGEILQRAHRPAGRIEGDGVEAKDAASDGPLNRTPRLADAKAALLETSNLTLKRHALLHKSERVTTGVAANPRTTKPTGAGSPSKAAAAKNRPPMAQTLAAGSPIQTRRK